MIINDAFLLSFVKLILIFKILLKSYRDGGGGRKRQTDREKEKKIERKREKRSTFHQWFTPQTAAIVRNSQALNEMLVSQAATNVLCHSARLHLN